MKLQVILSGEMHHSRSDAAQDVNSSSSNGQFLNVEGIGYEGVGFRRLQPSSLTWSAVAFIRMLPFLMTGR